MKRLAGSRIAAALLLGLPAVECPRLLGADAAFSPHVTDWLKDARLGVFMHFWPNRTEEMGGVDAFDVPAVVRQLKEMGAAYFVLTLGQNSGFYNSPNAVYDGFVGCAPGERCSRRDLPLDLHRALQAEGIRLMLYLPCQTPNQDAMAQRAFGLPEGKKDQPVDEEFARKWARVIHEWSARYGDKVSGWWFDGGYQHIRFNDTIAGIYADAVKRGNPRALVTFNPGVKLVRHTKAEDYTAGELNEPFEVLPTSRWVDGSQWHALTHLGSYWGGRDTRQPTERWIKWVRAVADKGGAVTLDLGPNADPAAGRVGTFSEAQVAQVKAIRAALPARDGAATPPGATPPTDMDAMRRVADLALIPPVMNTNPLPQYDYDRLDYGMTIGLERTPTGRLWACWVAGGDSPKAFFVLATSDDDGESWSKPRLVVDAHSGDLPMDRSVLVGNLWTDPTGRLWLFFDQSMGMFDGRAGVWASVCENPDADQPAWSPPRRIWHGVMLNKPTVLSTGEWMLPISLDQRNGFGPFKDLFRELDPLRGANVFVSSDRGATWSRRGAARFPDPDWHEHMIVERQDGTLWMLARTAKGLMQTISSDGGRTWAEPSFPVGIRQPNARFHVRRLASGRLLLVKHGDRIDAHEGRVKLSAWLSADEGKTWAGGLVLDDRKGVSYPDGIQAPDGTIYISYDRNRATDGEILLARFTEADVLARALVGPKSRLKMLISRPLGIKRKTPTDHTDHTDRQKVANPISV